MKVTFATKSENKKRQEEAFLALAPSERVARFFTLCSEIYKLQPPIQEDKGNFVLKKNDIRSVG